MKKIWLAGFGGSCYYLMELIWNGKSHWSMFLLGGLCFRLLGRVGRLPIPLFPKCLLGGAGITAAEFGAGLLLNVCLHWNIWDYSDLPFNLFGQICLPFTALWTLLSLPALKIDEALEKKIGLASPPRRKTVRLHQKSLIGR